MFHRFLPTFARTAKQVIFRSSSFSNCLEKKPLKMMHMDAANILMRSILPTNIYLQNLIEKLQKCDNDLEPQFEVSSLSQAMIITQGTLPTNSISDRSGMFVFPLPLNLDKLATMTVDSKLT